MTDWKAYTVHIVDRMHGMRKYGHVHTIEETNLRKGVKINNKEDKKAFHEALKYLVNSRILLFKSKDYARGDRAYFLNPSMSGEIERIFQTKRLFKE